MARFLDISGSHRGRICSLIFGFSDFSGLGLDIGLPIRGFIQGTHVMLLNA